MPKRKDGTCVPCSRCGSGRLTASPSASYCKPCVNEYAAERRRIRKEKLGTTMQKGELHKKLGCTPEQYAEAMATSDSCEICSSTHKLNYDHCHDTMQFRGVLCWDCNSAIGKLGDNVEGLQKALDYLRNHYEPT